MLLVELNKGSELITAAQGNSTEILTRLSELPRHRNAPRNLSKVKIFLTTHRGLKHYPKTTIKTLDHQIITKPNASLWALDPSDRVPGLTSPYTQINTANTLWAPKQRGQPTYKVIVLLQVHSIFVWLFHKPVVSTVGTGTDQRFTISVYVT